MSGQNLVIGSKNKLIDLIVFDVNSDIQLYKIVTHENKNNVNIWIEKMKLRHFWLWYKAEYNFVFLDENFKEIKREKIKLN